MSKHILRSEYAKKLLDPRWQKLRLEVLSRDNWTCKSCGAKDKTLHAHHVFYWPEQENPWDYPAETIVTVCDACHADEHRDMRQREAGLMFSACMAGFRTYNDVSRLTEILDTMAHAVKEPEREKELIQMIKDHMKSMRREVK